MLVKDGIAYLQAGVSFQRVFDLALARVLIERVIQGGIVFDSDPFDEWMETINKLGQSIPSCVLRLASCSRGRLPPRLGDYLTDRFFSDRCKHTLHYFGGRKASR